MRKYSVVALGVAFVEMISVGSRIFGVEADSAIEPTGEVRASSGGWVKHVAGSHHLNDVLSDGQGGWIGVGSEGYCGKRDGWWAHFDADGNYIKQQNFSGPPKAEELFGAAATSDGGWMLVGGTTSYGSEHYSKDGWVVKLTSSSKIQWQYAYRTPDSAIDDTFLWVTPADDGGYLLVGQELDGASFSYTVLTKLDPVGKVLWRKTYFWYPDYRYLAPISRAIQTTDKGWMLVLNTSYPGPLILKTDSEGGVVWSKTIDASRNAGYGRNTLAGANSVTGGGIVVVGATNSYGDTMDGWVVKVTEDGGIAWEYRYKTAYGDLFPSSVRELSDQSLLIAGRGECCVSNLRYLKLTSSGKFLWIRSYSDDDWNAAPRFAVSPDGSFLAPYTDSWGCGGTTLYKCDSQGNLGGNCPQSPKIKVKSYRTTSVMTDVPPASVSSGVPKRLNFKSTLKDTTEVVTSRCQ